MPIQKRNRTANCNRRAFVPSGGVPSLFGARNPAVGVSAIGVANGVVFAVAAAVCALGPTLVRTEKPV
jgi:hypothetical protein